MRKTQAQIALSVESKGIYTISMAARLLVEKPSTIKRWAFGYERRGSPYSAAIRADVPEIDGTRVLTFLELVELMFIQSLLRSGLSWTKVREASRVAAKLLHDEPHPFATKRWFADAAAIYLRLGMEHEELLLLEVAGHAQVSMEPILRPYLTQLRFDERGLAQRWYPMGFEQPVVVDPRRSFGRPVTATSGVATETIARLHKAGDSVTSIAAWFRIQDNEVEAALNFENSLTYAS